MQVDITRQPKLSRIDHLFVLLASGERTLDYEPALVETIQNAIGTASFEGRAEESITLAGGTPRKITLIGLGKPEAIGIRALRAGLRTAAKTAKKLKDGRIAIVFPYTLPNHDALSTLRLAADYLGHADYRYGVYKTAENDKQVDVSGTLVAPSSLDAKALKPVRTEAEALAEAVRIARDLGNAPCNVMNPQKLAERAAEISKELGIKCTVYGKAQIERMKMGGLLAVNRGSALEPRFVVMEYAPRRAKKHVALVGKGITFDSGGISIKPAEKMEEMKFDMCGAATVIGTMYAAATMQLPVHVTGIFAATENLPSGSAYKPGEIITMMSGKTVEVVNTDAEGRMILADALHYACRLKPDHLIDYATLTGACVVALGSEATGLFSTDDELAQKLIEGGERVGERLWRLPAWDEYKDLIRSEWADMKNSGGRWGGAITAAVFLKEFVDCRSWAHLDIAGTAYAESDTGRDPKGATGAGVRATIAFLESL